LVAGAPLGLNKVSRRQSKGVAAFDLGHRLGDKRFQDTSVKVCQALEVQTRVAHLVFAEIAQ
jgi:hypothetical protein